MTLNDLRTLQIGLELYKREKPLRGECESLISFLLRVLRHDILKLKKRAAAQAERRKARASLPKAALLLPSIRRDRPPTL